MQTQSGLRLLRHLRQADFFLIVGSLLRGILVVVLDTAIEVQELGP